MLRETELLRQIEKALVPGMHVPEPLRLLFNWIEEHGFVQDRAGTRVGGLHALNQNNQDENERIGGTDIEFLVESNSFLRAWFGHNRREVMDRLCVFARTGAEGSMAAFWLDENGNQKIVHLGTGSGSALVCVLTENAVDFLRLLAIGYEEICWSEDFDEPPSTEPEEDDPTPIGLPNVKFKKWVEDTFDTTVPATASEIVKHPSRMGDENSEDEFFRWVIANSG